MGFPLKRSAGQKIATFKKRTYAKRVKGAYRELGKSTARKVRSRMC